MEEKITTTEIYEKDKQWLRKIKIKKDLPGMKDSIRSIKKTIQKYKMEGELV